jgi:hypothetical protein
VIESREARPSLGDWAVSSGDPASPVTARDNIPGQPPWLSRAETSMSDFMAEQQCQSVGINPPHQRSDAERRSLGRNQLQLHRGASLQQCFRSDFRTMRADVHGSCQVSIRPYLDEQRPRHAGSRMVPSVLLSCNRHEGSITAIRVPKRGNYHGQDFRHGSRGRKSSCATFITVS